MCQSGSTSQTWINFDREKWIARRMNWYMQRGAYSTYTPCTFHSKHTKYMGTYSKSKWISCFENYLWIKTFDFPAEIGLSILSWRIATENRSAYRQQLSNVCIWMANAAKWNGLWLKHQCAMETHRSQAQAQTKTRSLRSR